MYITDVREQPMLDRADDAEKSVFLVDVTIFCEKDSQRADFGVVKLIKIKAICTESTCIHLYMEFNFKLLEKASKRNV
jgi:hypothetical protein